MSLSQAEELDYLEQLKQDEIEAARSNLLTFTQYTKHDYQVNWHHALTCEYLEKWVSGEIPRLLIFQPPRHGKSELVSRRLPAYIFGKEPDASIVATSYGADLASRMNRDVQRIIDTPYYRELFPDTRLNVKNIKTLAGTYLRNSEIFEIVEHKGVYKCAGVGGAITGMGGKYIIIDDPIKNQEEARSKTYRDKIWEWFTSTLYTRLEEDARLLITQTRWNEDDLSGRLMDLMEQDPEADQFVILSLPAIKEEEEGHKDDPRETGEALWKTKYDEDRLKIIKKTSGSRNWSALYQQTPAPETGNIIERGWWKFYTKVPEYIEWTSISWDFTFKGGVQSDYVCGQVWGKIGANRYLLDQVRDHMSFTETIQAMRSLNAKWQDVRENVVEEKANGSAIIDVLKNEIPAIIPINPKESKEARAHAVAPQIEAGNIFLPDPSLCPWVHDYVEEWAMFPNGKNDDQVDTTTQMLIRFTTSKGNLAYLDVKEDKEGMSEGLKELFWGSDHAQEY